MESQLTDTKSWTIREYPRLWILYKQTSHYFLRSSPKVFKLNMEVTLVIYLLTYSD
jgi:hypothetical protein